MGACASDNSRTGTSTTFSSKTLGKNIKRLKLKESLQKNYVAVCIQPNHDLTYDSTDSEITELAQERQSHFNINDINPNSLSTDTNNYLTRKFHASDCDQIHCYQPTNNHRKSSLNIRSSRLSKQRGCLDRTTSPHLVSILSAHSLTCNSECNADICTNPLHQEKDHHQNSHQVIKEFNNETLVEVVEEEVVEQSLAPEDLCPCSSEEDCQYDTFDEYEELEEENSEEVLQVLTDTKEEVMPDYQRYSREAPEKDPESIEKVRPSNNMQDCCRPCCPSKPKTKHASANNSNNSCLNHCSQQIGNNRHISESHVSCRNLPVPQHLNQSKSHPSHSRSAPIPPTQSNQQQRLGHRLHDSVPEQISRPVIPRRSSVPKTQTSQTTRKSNKQPTVRSYPSTNFEDRPHIPLPPPPQQFSSEHTLGHHQSGEYPRHSQHQHRDLTKREPRQTQTNNEEEMYSHNTNRNFSSKSLFNRRPSYNRQSLKPYPYEEPGGSTTYSHDSTCSNNCDGYNHCPVHHICRCQCLCASDANHHHCAPPHSDDQMSYCSDSSSSEYMNLAYQRTGDYPELMDELENTLSHRNRMRVQKTMQRFEMLSRQNKSLEKPIFEDEDSVRHYSKPDKQRTQMQADCKCERCEEKIRRSDPYNTRVESVVRSSNYPPTPFPRNSGYVEKVARYMDPNLNENTPMADQSSREGPSLNSRKSKIDEHPSHQISTTVTNSNGTWQMDSRKNEWVKVDNGSGSQNHYDFENNYPPLPPRPISENMYERERRSSNYNDRDRRSGMCVCTKCTRRQH